MEMHVYVLAIFDDFFAKDNHDYAWKLNSEAMLDLIYRNN